MIIVQYIETIRTTLIDYSYNDSRLAPIVQYIETIRTTMIDYSYNNYRLTIIKRAMKGGERARKEKTIERLAQWTSWMRT